MKINSKRTLILLYNTYEYKYNIFYNYCLSSRKTKSVMATLTINKKRIELRVGASYIIGNSANKENDGFIHLENTSIDAKHSLIEIMATGVNIWDLQSEEGTFISDTRLESLTKTFVREAISVKFGCVIGNLSFSESSNESAYTSDIENAERSLQLPASELLVHLSNQEDSNFCIPESQLEASINEDISQVLMTSQEFNKHFNKMSTQLLQNTVQNHVNVSNEEDGMENFANVSPAVGAKGHAETPDLFEISAISCAEAGDAAIMVDKQVCTNVSDIKENLEPISDRIFNDEKLISKSLQSVESNMKLSSTPTSSKSAINAPPKELTVPNVVFNINYDEYQPFGGDFNWSSYVGCSNAASKEEEEIKVNLNEDREPKKRERKLSTVPILKNTNTAGEGNDKLVDEAGSNENTNDNRNNRDNTKWQKSYGNGNKRKHEESLAVNAIGTSDAKQSKLSDLGNVSSEVNTDDFDYGESKIIVIKKLRGRKFNNENGVMDYHGNSSKQTVANTKINESNSQNKKSKAPTAKQSKKRGRPKKVPVTEPSSSQMNNKSDANVVRRKLRRYKKLDQDETKEIKADKGIKEFKIKIRRLTLGSNSPPLQLRNETKHGGHTKKPSNSTTMKSKKTTYVDGYVVPLTGKFAIKRCCVKLPLNPYKQEQPTTSGNSRLDVKRPKGKGVNEITGARQEPYKEVIKVLTSNSKFYKSKENEMSKVKTRSRLNQFKEKP